jgi:probable rRNA maturation factor
MDEVEVVVSVAPGVRPPLDPARVERAVLHVLRAEGISVAEISIALVGDAEIGALNEEYLGHGGPTDVISFHLHEAGDPPLGDVYVDVEQAERQAGAFGATAEEEVLRLAVHGALHVLGWDHPGGDHRLDAPMFRRQESLLSAYLASER